MVAIFFIVSLLVPMTTLFADSTGVVSTKKDDYKPKANVMITGEGFNPETVYTIEVAGPDNDSYQVVSENICTNKKGNFKYKYRLQCISDSFNPIGKYIVTVYDSSGAAVAGTQFTDGTVRW